MTRASPHIIVPADERRSDGTFFLPDYWYWEQARRAGVTVAQLLGPEFARSVIAIDDRLQAADLAYHLGGRAKKPTQNIVLIGPDGRTPIVIAGLGVTEAAELEETAIAAYEKRERLMAQGKPIVDFDELRERGGYARREDREGMIREALHDRVRRGRAHAVTDAATKRKKRDRKVF